MAAMNAISISMPQTLRTEAESLANTLNVSPSDLYVIAIEYFIQSRQNQAHAKDEHHEDEHPPALATAQRLVNQGDIYWVQLEGTDTLEPRIPHPHVVIQDNVLNHSRLSTVVVCALTSNLTRASLPGNVLLEVGEASLPRHSAVEVSKVSAIDKTQLGDYIGSLSEQRISQILAGMRFLQRSFFDV